MLLLLLLAAAAMALEKASGGPRVHASVGYRCKRRQGWGWFTLQQAASVGYNRQNEQ